MSKHGLLPPAPPAAVAPSGIETSGLIVGGTVGDQRARGAEVDRFSGVRLVHTTIHTEAFSQLRSAFDDRAPAR